MKPVNLRPADPIRDYSQLAAWFSSIDYKTTTENGHHNAFNAPMLAIDQKSGYTFLPGYYLMEKELQSS